MKRKHWPIALLLLAQCAYMGLRVHQAKAYMNRQIERLALQGLPGYVISGWELLSFEEGGDRFPSIAVRAERWEASGSGGTKQRHEIAVYFPWLPFQSPQHRI